MFFLYFRRKFILHYFGEDFDNETDEGGQMDDNMRFPKKKFEATNTERDHRALKNQVRVVFKKLLIDVE